MKYTNAIFLWTVVRCSFSWNMNTPDLNWKSQDSNLPSNLRQNQERPPAIAFCHCPDDVCWPNSEHSLNERTCSACIASGGILILCVAMAGSASYIVVRCLMHLLRRWDALFWTYYSHNLAPMVFCGVTFLYEFSRTLSYRPNCRFKTKYDIQAISRYLFKSPIIITWVFSQIPYLISSFWSFLLLQPVPKLFSRKRT